MAERVLFEVGPEDILRDVRRAVLHLETIAAADKDYFTAANIPVSYRAAEYHLTAALTWVRIFTDHYKRNSKED